MGAAKDIAEQFSNRKQYPHISEVLAALETVGVTDDVKKLAAICSAPSLFYGCINFSDDGLRKHNRAVIAEYIKHRYSLHHFHPCLYHIRNVLTQYHGTEFESENFIHDFLAGFDSLLQKFKQLFIEETGMAFTNEYKT